MFAVLVYVLTALAAVVVVLTRLRLRGDAAGRIAISDRLLHVHTIAGSAAWLVWVAFLVAPEDSALGGHAVGILGVALWWVTSIAGLLILARWLPAKGKHAGEASTDGWSQGPWLSVLAHVGLLVGTLVFTYAYLTSVV